MVQIFLEIVKVNYIENSSYHNNDLERKLCPDDIGGQGYFNENQSLDIASDNYIINE